MVYNASRLRKNITRFLEILETQEVSDSGKVFHPVTINSVRTLLILELDKIFKELREDSNLEEL